SPTPSLEPTHLLKDQWIVFNRCNILNTFSIDPQLLAYVLIAGRSHAVDIAHQIGVVVSFDPNYRSRLWDAATARAVLRPLMERADIVLMGHEDAQAVLGADDDA